ncbi:Nucleic acid dioxygenase alkbh1, partial [Perkinsus olseni]
TNNGEYHKLRAADRLMRLAVPSDRSSELDLDLRRLICKSPERSDWFICSVNRSEEKPVAVAAQAVDVSTASNAPLLELESMLDRLSANYVLHIRVDGRVVGRMTHSVSGDDGEEEFHLAAEARRKTRNAATNDTPAISRSASWLSPVLTQEAQVKTIGELLEENENCLRRQLEDVYLQKIKEIVDNLHSLDEAYVPKETATALRDVRPTPEEVRAALRRVNPHLQLIDCESSGDLADVLASQHNACTISPSQSAAILLRSFLSDDEVEQITSEILHRCVSDPHSTNLDPITTHEERSDMFEEYQQERAEYLLIAQVAMVFAWSSLRLDAAYLSRNFDIRDSAVELTGGLELCDTHRKTRATRTLETMRKEAADKYTSKVNEHGGLILFPVIVNNMWPPLSLVESEQEDRPRLLLHLLELRESHTYRYEKKLEQITAVADELHSQLIRERNRHEQEIQAIKAEHATSIGEIRRTSITRSEFDSVAGRLVGQVKILKDKVSHLRLERDNLHLKLGEIKVASARESFASGSRKRGAELATELELMCKDLRNRQRALHERELALSAKERQLFTSEHPGVKNRARSGSVAEPSSEVLRSLPSLRASLRETIELKEIVEKLLSSASPSV